MASSHYNPTYEEWNSPYSPHPPTAPLLPPLPPPPRQSHPESPNFYGRSSLTAGQRQDYHHYSRHQDLLPNPAVNQPSSYYSHHPPPPHQHHPPPLQHPQYIPQQATYEPQRISQPSISCSDSRDIPQSAWVGFKDKRPDSWAMDAAPGHTYQYDYARSSRDSPGISIDRGLDGISRSRDEFVSPGYLIKESGATRIEGNYQDRGQLKSDSDRYFRGLDEGNRGLSSSVAYGSDRYGVTVSRNMTKPSASHEGVRNQRWDEAHNRGRTFYTRKKGDYNHSEIERRFDQGRREDNNELNRTPRKQMQKKSALLRLETPRTNQNSRENDWSRHHSNYSGKRFNSNSYRGKEYLGHFDRGLVGKKRGRTPVDFDVSYKSNLLVGKPVASPTSAGIRSGVSVTPRSSKARRVLVTDGNEKASVSEGNGKLRTYFSDGAFVSESSRQSARQTSASEFEKKPGNRSTPSSGDSGDKLEKVRFVDSVVQDRNAKTTDTGPEASTHDSEAKVRSTVHAAEKSFSFSEAFKEARDDIDLEHDCNMEPRSTEEDVIDGDKSILKSHEDVLSRKSTGCNAGEALMPKVIEKEEIMKTKKKVSTSPVTLPLSWPKAADLSGCSEGGTHLAGNSMCSDGSQPCQDVDMDCVPSRNLSTMEVNAGSVERKSIGSLCYGEKNFEKSSVEASLSPENDPSKGRPKGVVSSISLDIANVSTDLAKAISLDIANISTDLAKAIDSFPGDLANAKSYPVGTYTTTMVRSPNMSVVFQVESENLSHCENMVNPSVENISRKEFIGTTPLNSTAEMADTLDSDEGQQTCVNGTSSSLGKVAVKGSSSVLPVERTDGCSRIEESDLAMAVSSEVCMENVSTNRYVPDEDLGLASCHPAEIPFVDQFNGSDSRVLKGCLSETNVSLKKDIIDGASKCLVEGDVSQKASTFCEKFPSSSAFAIETNLASGSSGISVNETVTDESGLRETQPCSTVCKFLPDDCFGCESSGAVGSVPNLSLDKNLEMDPSRVISCLVPDTSVSPCHVSPLVPVNEQIQSETSIQAKYCESQLGIMHKENSCAENIEVDTEEDKTKPSGGTFKCRTPGTDIIAVSGDSVFPCDSLSSSPRRSFRDIRSEIHVAAVVDEPSKDKEKPKPSGGTSKYGTPVSDTVAVTGDSAFPCDSLCSSPGLSLRQIRSKIHVSPVVDETSKVQESEKGDTLLDTLRERSMTSNEVTKQGNSSSHYPCLGQTSPSTDVDSYKHPVIKYPAGDLVEKPNGDPIKKLDDVTSDVGSQENHSLNSAKTDIFDGETLTSDGKVSGTEILGDSGVRLSKSHSHADVNFELTHVKDQVASMPHSDSQSMSSLSSRCEVQKRKKKFTYSTQKSYPCSLPSVSDTKTDANPPPHITKRHTWHRKSDTSASPFVAAKPSPSTLSTQQKFSKVTAQSSSSYVRKGNSLLRKPSHGSPGLQLNRFTTEDKSMGSSGRVDVDNTSFLVKTGELHTLERQSRPPSDSSTSKVSNFIPTSSGKCALSYSLDHLTTGLPESIMDSATSGEANVSRSSEDTFRTSDTLIQTGYTSDCQQKRGLPQLDSSNLKRMVYVKRKANQLVAASDFNGTSKSQIPSSDGYFKRNKNQLVRNSESRVNQSISVPNDALDLRAAANAASERSSSSAFSDSAIKRPFKQSKFSLVWTHNDPQSRVPIAHMQYQKILPQLVPWKRVTYWRRLMNTVSTLRNGSFSNISRKLSMVRKRHTVYTRSTNGYSLRKSKVLSIGGSHLKWSKSIERDSIKANEEATLAVAAFAKKESEKHSGQSNTRMMSRSHLARERVFRFGSLRYKMDSSRRTLQRISDVDLPCSGPSEIVKGAKRRFIPNRLVIGNEEYVRVGNGNQLVRDPKKRTRVLANEKVRWSLHNVRLRLAKKKKYCQFFTRFGKCNKDDGKCPYVHDPSKIAVCTKFLNGLCVNSNCKLTHKVIPERMPDCSYFLQGLCNNKACPYRHVHVNPSAAICDGFLKGYCSDGDECRKKHSYICPVFEATGSCSQGSKCKLHHPKNQSKGSKRKRPNESSQKNARGRYFGSLHEGLSESEPMVFDRRSTDSEGFGKEGLDFIILGATTEYEAGGNTGPDAEQSISSDSEVPVSLYNLIIPAALMQ